MGDKIKEVGLQLSRQVEFTELLKHGSEMTSFIFQDDNTGRVWKKER